MKISLILFFFYSQVFGSRKLNNDEMIQLNKEGFVLCKNLVNNEDLDFLIQEGKNTIKINRNKKVGPGEFQQVDREARC